MPLRQTCRSDKRSTSRNLRPKPYTLQKGKIKKKIEFQSGSSNNDNTTVDWKKKGGVGAIDWLKEKKVESSRPKNKQEKVGAGRWKSKWGIHL